MNSNSLKYFIKILSSNLMNNLLKKNRGRRKLGLPVQLKVL
jgi:hypothetical protein